MSNSNAIEVDHVSKKFVLGQKRVYGHATLRDQVDQLFQKGVHWLRKPRSESITVGSDFWALNDVSFNVKSGEMVGIIGRNGAGKSTLLKILSRITPPTSGSVRVNGRIASLLEVGTGFHPELTGRENVYLNGAILGMGRTEIRAKFDEIVAFAGVEKFIDTPVKRYSSGMYVRLAFSVAAHLQPDILVVDEVLSVGDIAFQRKCAETMNATAKGNRTVLLVSHNLQAIRTLCSRVILLDHGRVIQDGAPEDVLPQYVRLLQQPRDISRDALSDRMNRCSGKAVFSSFRVLDKDGKERYTFRSHESAKLRLEVSVKSEVPSMGVYCLIRSALTGESITSVVSSVCEHPLSAGQKCQIEIEIPQLLFRPGEYSFYVCVGEKEGGRWYDIIDENIQLPFLTIATEDNNTLKTIGVFSLPAKTSFMEI